MCTYFLFIEKEEKEEKEVTLWRKWGSDDEELKFLSEKKKK